MDERIPDQPPMNTSLMNSFVRVPLYCGGAAFVLIFAGPAALLSPIVCLIGIVTGIIIILIHAHYNAQQPSGIAEVWGSTALCTLIFVATGIFFASFGNYAETPQYSIKLRALYRTLDTYAQDHHGHYPSAISELGLPLKDRTYKIFHFSYLYSKRPYLFNGHLAGQPVDAIKYPERTLLIAPGKRNGVTLFYCQADMDMDKRVFMFVDGHLEGLPEQDIAKRFPPNGTVTEKTWFIEPVLLSYDKR